MAKNKWLFLAKTAYDIYEDTNSKLLWNFGQDSALAALCISFIYVNFINLNYVLKYCAYD